MFEGCSADAVCLLLEVEVCLEKPELFLDHGVEGASFPSSDEHVVNYVHQRAC